MVHPRAAEWLRSYYDPTGTNAGSTFLDLGPNDPYDITATDLYALSLLDVRAKPLAGRRLLEPGGHRSEILTALRDPDLPDGVDLLNASDKEFAAAERLYLACRRALGSNPWVTASKLCARKRPRFFPIRDTVVTELMLGLGRDYLLDWRVYQEVLRQPDLMSRLQDLTEQAGALLHRPGGITDPPLRVLDVLLWKAAPAGVRRRR